jgi:hypothetical protein
MHIIFFLLILLILQISHASQSIPLHLLNLQPGFKAEIFARVPNARSMAEGNQGTVFVGTLSGGNVYAIINEGKERKVITIAKDLTMPNGIAFHNGSLFVAEMHRILRYDHIEKLNRRVPSHLLH